MKILFALLAFSLLAMPTPARAFVNSSLAVRNVFSLTNVSVSAYTELVHSISKAVKGISVFSTSENPITLAIGSSGSEQDQMVLAPGTLPGNDYAGSPVGSYNVGGQGSYLPIQLSQGSRISVKCLRSTCTKGELELNFYYY